MLFITKAALAKLILMHGLAFGDAYVTNRFISQRVGHEINPLAKPFAGTPAIYGFTQVSPIISDVLAAKHSKYAKWFSTVSIGSSAVGVGMGVRSLEVGYQLRKR